MKREALSELEKWKASARRKPLIVEGARQVGKTWLVMEFARLHYEAVAYVNFEEQPFLRDLFRPDFDVRRILAAISAATHTRCVAGRTLIFLDEIQEAHGGLTALKYFCENAPEHHVVVAGSLLGLELHRHTSFPVGKVQFLRLHPMSFLEFLRAMNEEGLADYVAARDTDGTALFADRLRELLKHYYYVGGMPEAVLTFSRNRDWTEVRDVQREILDSYERDFSKHAPADIVPRIRQLWNSLPAQLSRENRKFLYGVVREGARAREYEAALQWLIDGGMVHRVCAVSAPRLPLKSYEDHAAFKLFSLDVGLLAAQCNLDMATLVRGNRIFTEFKGALTEQYVLQQLIIRHEPFYWSKPNAQQEVDFLLQLSGRVVPIEVKAEENLRAKSLRQFVQEHACPEAYRLSMSDYRREPWMTNLPLFMANVL